MGRFYSLGHAVPLKFAKCPRLSNSVSDLAERLGLMGREVVVVVERHVEVEHVAPVAEDVAEVEVEQPGEKRVEQRSQHAEQLANSRHLAHLAHQRKREKCAI